MMSCVFAKCGVFPKSSSLSEQLLVGVGDFPRRDLGIGTDDDLGKGEKLAKSSYEKVLPDTRVAWRDSWWRHVAI